MTIRRSGSYPRTAVVLILALLLVGCVLLVSLLVGTRILSPDEIIRGLLGIDEIATPVIWQLRLPRTVLGLLVGLALGAAGVVAQAVTRNPLADPGLLGISAGAALAIVAGSTLLGISGGVPQLLLALLGAAIATAAVYAFATRAPEGLTPVSMTLAGMAITACLSAAVSAIVLLSARTMDQYRFWVVGALTVSDQRVFAPAVLAALAGLVLVMIIAGPLNMLALGDDTAAALGVHVLRTRVLAGIAVVLLSGTAVSLAGPIGFVGLIVPHAARMLVGHDVRRVLAVSALIGPILLLASDVIGRIVARPSELQVGVVTALVGTPLFVWLIRRTRTGAAKEDLQ